jgi:arginyl-tRNA synthetase
LIGEAIQKAQRIFKKRLPDASQLEIQRLGRILGIDAIKYADLASHRIKDYVFSYDRMLCFEGNTAAFLLYSFVRIQGIKRRLSGELDIHASVVLCHQSERILALHLCRFGETLEAMARDLLPNRLCEYLYELAEAFNAFFHNCQVIGSEEQKSRLVLVKATEQILGKGLELLGLKTLPRM